MYALSLKQPWATLLALGCKRIETRPMRPLALVEGPAAGRTFLIHASKELSHAGELLVRGVGPGGHYFRDALERNGYHGPEDLVYGAIIGAATCAGYALTDALLRASVVVEQQPEAGEWARGWPLPLTPQEIAFGDYGPGRYGWLCKDAKRLTQPVPVKGQLGLWPVPVHVRAEAVRHFNTSGVPLYA